MPKAKDATVRWVGGMQFIGESGSGHAIVMDTPDRNTAASPMELVLVALAGCTAVDVVTILKKKRQRFHNLEVNVHAHQRDEPPNIYTDIEVEYVVYGKDLSEKAVQQAIELSETKYCSVAGMLNKVAAITTKYKIIREQDEKGR